MSSEKIDIKHIIESGSETADLTELVQRGFKRVRVVDDTKIESLVQEAVENVISGRAQDLALELTRQKLAQQKDQFKRQATKEFKRLFALHQKALHVQQEISSSRDTLQTEVEALRAQMSSQHKLIETLSDNPYDKEAQQQQQRLESIEREMNALLGRLEDSDKQRREAEARVSDLSKHVLDLERERKEQERKDRERKERVARENGAASVAAPAAAPVGQRLQQVLQDLRAGASGESNEALQAQVQDFRRQLSALQDTIESLNADIAERERRLGDQARLVDQLEERCRMKEEQIAAARAAQQAELEALRESTQGQRERDQSEVQELASRIAAQEDDLSGRQRQIDELYREKNEFKKRIDELEQQIRQGTFQPIEGDTRGAAVRQILDQERHIEAEIQRLWKDFQTKDAAVKPLTQKRDDVRSRRALLTDPNDPQLDSLRDQETNLNAAIAGLEDERDRISRVIKNNRIKLGELRVEREALQREVENNCQYLFDELRHQQTDREHKIVSLETDRQKLQRELKNLRGRREALEARYATEKSREESLRRQIEAETGSLQTLRAEREEIDRRKQALEAEVEELRARQADMQTDLERKRESMDSRAGHVALAMRLEDATTMIDELLKRNQELESAAQAVAKVPVSQVPAQPAAVQQPQPPMPAPAQDQAQIYGPYNSPMFPYLPQPQQMHVAPPAPAAPQQFLPMLRPLPRRDQKAVDKEGAELRKKIDVLTEHIQLLERKLHAEANDPYDGPADPNLVIVLEPRKPRHKK